MKVIRKINTSALLVEDQEGRELIVLGKGLSFKIENQNYISNTWIEKTFFLETPQLSKHFIQLLEKIPIEFINFSVEMIEMASLQLNCELHSNIYISLPDHIAFTIERCKNGIMPATLLLSELQAYYPEEYDVSKSIVNHINTRFNVSLDDSEIAYIAFHLINATLNEVNSKKALKITTMISKITQLIEAEIDINFDRFSLDYSRLILHIKFFAQRVLLRKQISEDDIDIFDTDFFERKEYKISKNIIQQIEKEFDVVVTNQEIGYMAIHILKIAKPERKETNDQINI